MVLAARHQILPSATSPDSDFESNLDREFGDGFEASITRDIVDFPLFPAACSSHPAVKFSL